MLNRFRSPLKVALASVALGTLVPLAACNKAVPEQSAYRLPDLPATLPLALGEERPIAKAPAAKELPRVRQIKAARVANPDDYYAYADDAWSYYDALGDAPPDYGFYYGDIEPWAWQGYDDSLMFVEPLDYGYRSYYYRPGEQYPYFIRDPYYGYGYNDGLLAVVYNALGGIIPYDDWYGEPYLDYASSYYGRGYDLYSASRYRHPVIAANWYAVQPAYNVAFLDWEDDLWRQPDWWDYHTRTFDNSDLYWRTERERRLAEGVRYAAWQDLGFQSAPPPRAIPRNWRKAAWASDERWFEPAVSGFVGDAGDQQRAARRERQRVAALSAPTAEKDRVQLAELRQRVRNRPDMRSQRNERMADLRQDLDRRQVQLASRDDRSALRERSLLQRQERALDRAQQNDLGGGRGEFRPDRSAENQRFVSVDRRQIREADRAQRLDRAERRQQDGVARSDRQQQRQFTGDTRQQRLRGQAQIEARAKAESGQQARAEVRQRREAQSQARGAEAQQRRQVRADAQQRGQAQSQARVEARQRREAQMQVRQQREQSRAATSARSAQREQAREAAQQQRASREQARAQAGARSAQHEQARQAAQQQRASREQARAQASVRSAQREQARQQRSQAESQARAQAAQQQQTQREQSRQVAQQQRAARQQQVVQAEAGPTSADAGGKGRGRGHN